jgi:hypothetical protein
MKAQLLNRPQLTPDYKAKWIYLVQNPVSWLIEGVAIPDCNIYSGEYFLGYYRSGKLTIRAGYAFDGMTNYPDTPQNLADALLHDFLYQTRLVTRLQADRLFLASMTENKTPNRHVIFAAVRALGWIFYGEENTIQIRPV